MTPASLRDECLRLRGERERMGIKCGDDISLHHRRGWRRPPKWPRGELLCETETGRLYAFPIAKVLKWCDWAEKSAACCA